MLSILGKHLTGFKKESILTPCFMVLEVSMEMIIPLMMASIVDKGVNAGNMNHIFKMGFCMVLVAIAALYGGVMGGRCSAKASSGLAKNIRSAMYDNIQTFSFANIDKFSTAGLITRMTTDINNVQNAYQMILRNTVHAIISVISAISVVLIINAKLAKVYIGAAIVLIVIMAVILPKSKKYFSCVFPKYDELNESIKENITAIRVVKSFVREDYEKERFSKANNGLYKMFVKAESLFALGNPVMRAVMYVSIMIISWVGAKMVVNSELTTGELMSTFTYCMNILMSLLTLSAIVATLTMSVVSAKRIAEVLDEKTTLKNTQNPVMEIKDGSICFENVSFKYHEGANDRVLKDINLKINAGETIGIIGATGSSKSTLANVITRIYDVTEGSVKIGGVDVRDYDLEVLRNEVTVVLQQNVLFTGTILDNLRWGNKEATEEECIRVCEIACADDFIRSFEDGYHTYLERGGVNLSGGQKQRICIARALLKNPKILIMDDSTSAVDTATDAKIRKALKDNHSLGIEGNRNHEATYIIIAQRISSVMSADRIIVMEDGAVNGFGTHEELLASNEIYKEIYELQTGGGGDFDERSDD
ncbi:MAG: ABC transporter ATP-binding protein [Lachnospiraceae bacterium]|nr:ABC transporter ATP-binding protein [Lachnospiraceae bacterium]